MNIKISKITVGSRKSLLAKEHIKIFEKKFYEVFGKSSSIRIEKKFYKTSGDAFLNKKISDIGNKGLFTKEIDDALIYGDINLGIHSLKDLPTILPKGLEIGAILKREDFREVIISNKGYKVYDLESKAVIGTSSIRRRMQLERLKKKLVIKDIRGNIDTRINKVLNKEYDAILLAYAGIKRLGIETKFNVIDPRIITPALGQGAIALVWKKTNLNVNSIIKKLNHTKTSLETECERNFLRALDGNCQTPVGGYAIIKNINGEKKIIFSFKAFSKDGVTLIKDRVCFNLNSFRTESFKLGVKVKQKIKV